MAVSDPARARVVLAWADPAAAQRAEVPGRAGLVEDRQEEMEHQEFEEVWTSYLIETASGSGCIDSPDSHRANSKDSLDGPEGKLFSCFDAGILKID